MWQHRELSFSAGYRCSAFICLVTQRSCVLLWNHGGQMCTSNLRVKKAGQYRIYNACLLLFLLQKKPEWEFIPTTPWNTWPDLYRGQSEIVHSTELYPVCYIFSNLTAALLQTLNVVVRGSDEWWRSDEPIKARCWLWGVEGTGHRLCRGKLFWGRWIRRECAAFPKGQSHIRKCFLHALEESLRASAPNICSILRSHSWSPWLISFFFNSYLNQIKKDTLLKEILELNIKRDLTKDVTRVSVIKVGFNRLKLVKLSQLKCAWDRIAHHCL